MSSCNSDSSHSNQRYHKKSKLISLFRKIRGRRDSSTSKSEVFVDQERFLTSVDRYWNQDDESIYESIESDLHIKPLSLKVEAELRITTKRQITSIKSLRNKINVWIDEFNGRYILKPYYTLIYLLLSAKLHEVESPNANIIYYSSIDDIVKFGCKEYSSFYREDEYQFVHQHGFSFNYYSINFSIKIKESKRNGEIFPLLFKKGGHNVEFKDLVEDYGLTLSIDETGLIYPHY